MLLYEEALRDPDRTGDRNARAATLEVAPVVLLLPATAALAIDWSIEGASRDIFDRDCLYHDDGIETVAVVITMPVVAAVC